LRAFQQAIAQQRICFEKEPQMAQFRQFLSLHYTALAEVHSTAGQVAEAATATLERRNLWPSNPAELHTVASELAQYIPLVGQGRSRLTAEEPTQRRAYAAQALDTLRQAIAHGLKDGERLKKDSAFHPLRSEEEFQKLLVESMAKGKGKAK
jgi:hypothetical protein